MNNDFFTMGSDPIAHNRRIFFNIIATYGRSLYALVIGLFCGWWTLMALGESCGRVFLYHGV